MLASTVTMGSTSAGKSTFLIRLPPAMRTLDDSSSDEENQVHGRMPQNMKRAYGSRSCGAVGQHDREDERVDEQQQQRVDERPEEAQHRAAVTRLQVARDQRLDERTILEQGPQILEHQGVVLNRGMPQSSVLGPQSLDARPTTSTTTTVMLSGPPAALAASTRAWHSAFDVCRAALPRTSPSPRPRRAWSARRCTTARDRPARAPAAPRPPAGRGRPRWRA